MTKEQILEALKQLTHGRYSSEDVERLAEYLAKPEPKPAKKAEK